mgnify:CR=1 FL=1
MMKIIFLFFLFIFTTTQALAEIKNKIIENLKNIENISFHFEQNINGKMENGKCIIQYPKIVLSFKHSVQNRNKRNGRQPKCNLAYKLSPSRRLISRIRNCMENTYKKTNDIFSKHEENYHKLGQQKSQNDPKSKSYRTKKSTSRALPLINKITNHHQANYKINTY